MNNKYAIVEIHLKETSFPIVHDNVRNAYQKGDLYCVYCDDDKVYKYPISDIFRVVESYHLQMDGE